MAVVSCHCKWREAASVYGLRIEKIRLTNRTDRPTFCPKTFPPIPQNGAIIGLLVTWVSRDASLGFGSGSLALQLPRCECFRSNIFLPESRFHSSPFQTNAHGSDSRAC